MVSEVSLSARCLTLRQQEVNSSDGEKEAECMERDLFHIRIMHFQNKNKFMWLLEIIINFVLSCFSKIF